MGSTDQRSRIFFLSFIKIIIFLLLLPAVLHSYKIHAQTELSEQTQSFFETKDTYEKIQNSATEPLKITLHDALLMAIQNNVSLKAEKFEPSIKKTFEKEKKGIFDPKISQTSSVSHQINDSTTISSTTGLTLFSPTGTAVTGEIELEKESQYTSGISIGITQSVLRGGGKKVNLASIRQAELDTLSSKYELRRNTELLVASVEKAYWDYYLAQKQLEIYNESFNLAQKQLEETKERIEVGVLAEIEMVAAQAEAALRKEALINAQANLEIKRLKLLSLILPPEENFWSREIVLLDKPVSQGEELKDIILYIEKALRTRADLEQARLLLRKGELEVIKTRNGLLPKIDLFISLGKEGYSSSPGGAIKDLGGENYTFSGGVTLELPFKGREAKAKHERALLSKNQAEDAVRNLMQLIQVDVLSAYVQVKKAQEQIEATKTTKLWQKEKLRAEMEKFEVGKSTALLIAQAQRDLLNSEISEAEAIVNYLSALTELYYLEGSILQRHGISSIPIE